MKPITREEFVLAWHKLRLYVVAMLTKIASTPDTAPENCPDCGSDGHAVHSVSANGPIPATEPPMKPITREELERMIAGEEWHICVSPERALVLLDRAERAERELSKTRLELITSIGESADNFKRAETAERERDEWKAKAEALRAWNGVLSDTELHAEKCRTEAEATAAVLREALEQWRLKAQAYAEDCDEVQAERDQAREEVKRLTDERDEWKAKAEKPKWTDDQIHAVVIERDTALAQVAMLREAVVGADIAAAIRAYAPHRPTRAEMISWVYGQANLSNPDVTREMAEKAVDDFLRRSRGGEK